MEHMEDKSYYDSIHRLGRISTAIALLALVGAPVIIWCMYGFPTVNEVITPTVTLLIALAPTMMSEVISYAPILGSASYMAFITGNVMNLKLPVAISAQNLANAEPNTSKADAVATMAIAVSSIVTILIIALGVVLMTPLQPVLQSAMFQTASNYIVPALIGGLMFNTFFVSGGKNKINKKWMLCTLPLAIITVCVLTIDGFSSYQGFAIIAMIFVTIAWAYFLYKKNLVTVGDGSKTEQP